MIPITAKQLAEVLGGELFGDGEKSGSSAETDSRQCVDSSIFFAKPGEVADGHDFVEAAKANGATIAVVEHRVESEITQVVVANTVRALGDVAGWLLSKLRENGDLKVIGITGSNGKTTTKNMLREILSKAGKTIAPIESFNNQVGAPISMLRADSETKFLVVEMGAEGIGSIAYLASIAKPDIGVVLKVGMAHAGEFGGIENTAKIKSELASAIGRGGDLFLNCDDGYVREMEKQSSGRIHFFGTASESEFRASGIALTPKGTEFTLHFPDGKAKEIKLNILGEHHVMNALAAAAVGYSLGISEADIVSSLEAMQLAERWRMQRLVREDGVIVINDAYNASPDSMKAALRTLAQLGKFGTRTIAVLGEMAELGPYSVEEHDAIGRLVVRLNIDQLVVVGERAKLIHMGASQEGSWDGESKFFETIDEALAYLRGILSKGDTVLVKSSKSANLRFLGDDLMEAAK